MLATGEEGFLGNSRNSPTLQHSPFGKSIDGEICAPSTGLLTRPVVTLSHPLPAGTRQEGSQPLCAIWAPPAPKNVLMLYCSSMGFVPLHLLEQVLRFSRCMCMLQTTFVYRTELQTIEEICYARTHSTGV